MFGIVRPCRHSLSPELDRQWWSHLCGLCLGLRDGHGQHARLATNVDAVALSVLTDAQRSEAAATRKAGPCPFRSFHTADVVRAAEPAIDVAVSVSLTLGAVKIEDHVADADGWAARLPVVPRVLARRWAKAGAVSAPPGLDTAAMRTWATESARREARAGLPFEAYAEPTEEAAAIVCRHTAVLADRSGNVEALDELGRMFGRTVYLLDAVRDLADDQARGRFNPLVATVGDPRRRLEVAVDLVAGTQRRLTAAFERLDLPRPDLARALFVDEVRRAGQRALRAAGIASREHQPSCRHHPAVAMAGGVLAIAAFAAPGSSEDDNRSCWRRCTDNCDCDCPDCDCCCDGCCCDCGCDC
jgi:hypothetical protein